MKELVINEALKWVGYLEKKTEACLEDYTKNVGYNNYTIFATQYKKYFNVNLQGQPWCAVFVSCVFANALGKENQQKIMPEYFNCEVGVTNFKKIKRWHTYPSIGDVIFFKDSTGKAGHTGIVYQIDSNFVYTVEGNTSSSNGVVSNGGGVFKKKYSRTYNRILGYGNPNYETLNKNNSEHWAKNFLDKLYNKGFISNKEDWSKYEEPVTKSYVVALIDKITGGIWKSNESNSNIHWSQPYIISLCGKNIIQNKEEWINNPDSYISKSLLLALIDKATGGTKEKYLNVKYDYWARANLNSLCDKGIIENPEVWSEDFEGWVTKGELMALLCKAYKI